MRQDKQTANGYCFLLPGASPDRQRHVWWCVCVQWAKNELALAPASESADPRFPEYSGLCVIGNAKRRERETRHGACGPGEEFVGVGAQTKTAAPGACPWLAGWASLPRRRKHPGREKEKKKNCLMSNGL